MLCLAVGPSGRLAAQGVLSQFSYDNLRLSGIQVDAGLIGASELVGTTAAGLRVDYGRIAPRVRLLLGLSYFHSQFDQASRDRFERRLDSIVNPSTPDNINLGRIALSDLIADIDFQLVFPQGRGITAYLGTGVSIHARNGSGAAVNGTFVEDALDVITAGLNGTLGFEFDLSRAWRFQVDGRGVVSCTPNHLHEIHVTSALAAGVHVLCERPLALTLAGIERALAATDRYGKRVMVGMNHRFRSDVQAVRGFLAGGDLGALQAVRGGWYTFQPSRGMLGWRLRREQAGGGAVLDLGLPLIDLGLWLAGWPAPKRISAHVMRPGMNAVEDMGSALVVCENGVSITMDVSWRHLGEGERFWFDIVGAKGSAMIQPLSIFKEQHGAAVDVTPTGATGRETQFTQSYRAEWMYFLAVIKGDVNAPPPRDQLALQRVLDAIYRSADEGRDVLL